MNYYENNYGVHIVFHMHEQTKPLSGEVTDEMFEEAVGDFVGKVTYHVNTNSCTVSMDTLNEKYQPNILVRELVGVLKTDWVPEMLKQMAGVERYMFKPVWCKQLNRHFM